MKKFSVNNHKLATVECDIPFSDCPVYQMLQEKRYATGAEYVGTSISGDDVSIGTVIGHTRALKEEIMNLCVNCNVQGR